MPRSRSKVIGIALLLLAAIVAWPAASEFVAVDACLDAGGSFNYVVGACDFQQSHPYAPFVGHSPWLLLVAGAVAIGGLFALARRAPRA